MYIGSEQGKLLVLKMDDAISILAKHNLDARVFASPVVCDRQLLVRTEQTLYCIGKTSVADRSGS